MANSVVVDDISNAVAGTGVTVDLANQLGIVTGGSVTCHGGVVGETGVSAGAVALQLGVAGPTGIVWSPLGTPVSVPSGGGATIPAPTAVAGATHARVVVTTTLAGGKCTAVVVI
jgi:hypothetical protein